MPIDYESRPSKLKLPAADRPPIDLEFEEINESGEVECRARLKTKWAQLEALVGSGKRIELIARQLVEAVMKNVTIDCTVRENVRDQLRVIVKRIFRKHGYPPDKQEKATQTELEQAELLSEAWVAA